MKKQVDKTHYQFSHYVNKRRWISIWHQVDEVISLAPRSVLEVGPGPGIFKQIVTGLGYCVETVDIDSDLQPDHVASVTALPFSDGEFDLVCAFQMLEHLPYEESKVAFKEMVRVSRKNLVISLPDAKSLWRYIFHIPKLGDVELFMPRPRLIPLMHEFDGEHYWEINKRGYALSRVIKDFGSCGAHLKRTYRVKENPYHRFFIYKKDKI